jgi:hypothetical protein
LQHGALLLVHSSTTALWCFEVQPSNPNDAPRPDSNGKHAKPIVAMTSLAVGVLPQIWSDLVGRFVTLACDAANSCSFSLN